MAVYRRRLPFYRPSAAAGGTVVAGLAVTDAAALPAGWSKSMSVGLAVADAVALPILFPQTVMVGLAAAAAVANAVFISKTIPVGLALAAALAHPLASSGVVTVGIAVETAVAGAVVPIIVGKPVVFHLPTQKGRKDVTDLATKWGDGVFGDLALGPLELEEDGTVETAVVISLFSDRRAEPGDELPDGAGDDPRGWWGDAAPPALADGAAGPDRIGSRLWLLRRAKQTTETLNRARDYATEALGWLIDDGVATAVEIEAEWQGQGVLALAARIELTRGSVYARNFELRLEGV